MVVRSDLLQDPEGEGVVDERVEVPRVGTVRFGVRVGILHERTELLHPCAEISPPPINGSLRALVETHGTWNDETRAELERELEIRLPDELLRLSPSLLIRVGRRHCRYEGGIAREAMDDRETVLEGKADGGSLAEGVFALEHLVQRFVDVVVSWLPRRVEAAHPLEGRGPLLSDVVDNILLVEFVLPLVVELVEGVPGNALGEDQMHGVQVVVQLPLTIFGVLLEPIMVFLEGHPEVHPAGECRNLKSEFWICCSPLEILKVENEI